MRNIKLVHVSSSLRMGGAEQILFLLVQHLQALGFAQTVIYVHDGPYRHKIESLGVKTIAIRGGMFLYDPLFMVRLYKAIRDQKPDIIHSMLWAANVSARICAQLLGIPIVSVYHNNVDQDGIVRSLLDCLTMYCADALIAVSQQVAAPLAKRSWLGKPAVKIINNGIDTDALDQVCAITKQELGLPEQSFIIGAVGRCVPVKRFDYLLHVFAQLKINDSYVVLIGSGEQEVQLKSLAHSLGLQDRVLFLIGVSALGYYALFDCFVQTSYKEGISLALLEAMYFHKPCIVMGHEQYHPVVEHEKDGLVIAPHNESELIGALDRLYTDRHYGDMLAIHARDKVIHHFGVSKMIHQYKTLFEQVAMQ